MFYRNNPYLLRDEACSPCSTFFQFSKWKMNMTPSHHMTNEAKESKVKTLNLVRA